VLCKQTTTIVLGRRRKRGWRRRREKGRRRRRGRMARKRGMRTTRFFVYGCV